MTSQFKAGDAVCVKGWPPVEIEVTDAGDKAYLVPRGPTGQTLKVARAN